MINVYQITLVLILVRAASRVNVTPLAQPTRSVIQSLVSALVSLELQEISVTSAYLDTTT